MTRKIALYPGTYDPLTFGHLDIIKRATKIIDLLYVAVANNKEKKCLFSVKDRIDIINKTVAQLPKSIKNKIKVVPRGAGTGLAGSALPLADCVLLGYLGAMPAEGIYVILSRIATAYYFFHFLILFPLLPYIEKTKPLPISISEPVLSGSSPASAFAFREKK